MKDYQKIFDEVSIYLSKESKNYNLPIENRVFIKSMLIFIDTIIDCRSDVFNLVFKEIMELEEAEKN